jgi:hypothetical protein
MTNASFAQLRFTLTNSVTCDAPNLVIKSRVRGIRGLEEIFISGRKIRMFANNNHTGAASNATYAFRLASLIASQLLQPPLFVNCDALS